MKYLLDTNVLDGIKHFTFERSRKKRISPNPGVVRFFLSAGDDALFVPSLVIGELFYGAENAWRRNDSKNAVEYEHFANMMLEHYEDRIVPFDATSAAVWAKAHRSGNGGDPHMVDKQIAAIALTNDMVVVTRDIKPNRGLNCPAWGDSITHVGPLGTEIRFARLTLLDPFTP